MNRRDAVIVGAGPAGIAAAAVLAERGVATTLVDESPDPGGQIWRAPPPGVPEDGFTRSLSAHRLRDPVMAAFEVHSHQVEYLAEHIAYACTPHLALSAANGRASTVLHARALLLATGAFDRTVPFPGWTLPGVFTTGGLLSLVQGHGVVPEGPVVIAGAGLLQLLAAARLCALGRPPVALVEATRRQDLVSGGLGLWSRPGMLLEGARLLDRILVAGVPVLRGHAVVRAYGEDRLERVEVQPVDRSWMPLARAERILDARVLATGFGLRPESALARIAGVPHRTDPARGGLLPQHDERRQTPLPGLFVAGDGSGVQGAEIAVLQGRLAALAMAERLGADRAGDREHQARLYQDLRQRERARRSLDHAYRLRPGIWRTCTPDTVVCRCEGVTAAEVRRWHRRGATTPTSLKMATRAGMGRCQGRFCEATVSALCGEPEPDSPPLSVRPPARPVPLEALANHR